MSASLLIPEVRMESLEVVRTGVIPAPKTGASNPVKQCRRIATQYGQYLAFVKLTLIWIWARADEYAP